MEDDSRVKSVLKGSFCIVEFQTQMTGKVATVGWQLQVQLAAILFEKDPCPCLGCMEFALDVSAKGMRRL